MLIVGCGGESDRATSTTDAATTAAPPNLDQYLLQADEGPGLEPMSSPQTDSGEPFICPRAAPSCFGAVATSRRPTSPVKATASPASAASCCSRPRLEHATG